ncbi:MAG: PEP-CTERM sorting domain-containing protein [Candidatus Sulfotelmatobacter sp.]
MKRLVVLALVSLTLPLAAYANEVDFGTSSGMITYSSSTNTLSGTGIVINSASNFGTGLCSTATPCGSVTFTTGALISGNETTGTTFGPGGTITITGNGVNGVPNGVLFTGTFTGDTDWQPSGKPGVSGNISYDLFGNISGTWFNGTKVSGSETEITLNTGMGGFQGSANLAGGEIYITTTPEPGTLALLGTGLLGLAGVVRRKLN